MDAQDLGMVPVLFGKGRSRSTFEKESGGADGSRVLWKVVVGTDGKQPKMSNKAISIYNEVIPRITIFSWLF